MSGAPELLRVCFGEVIPQADGVLVSMWVLDSRDGAPVVGRRDPLVMLASQLRDLAAALPAVLAMLVERPADARERALLTDVPDWNEGATRAEAAGTAAVCAAFGFHHPEPQASSVLAMIAVQVAGVTAEHAADYRISYSALREFAEALPKVVRRIDREGAKVRARQG